MTLTLKKPKYKTETMKRKVDIPPANNSIDFSEFTPEDLEELKRRIREFKKQLVETETIGRSTRR